MQIANIRSFIKTERSFVVFNILIEIIALPYDRLKRTTRGIKYNRYFAGSNVVI